MNITASNELLWQEMGRLRARTYLSKGFITEEQINEDGCEFDEYDACSDHFIAVNDNGDVIGTVRVINRGAEASRLPAEDEFNIILPDQTQEVSRLIHDERLSAQDGVMVSLAMIRAIMGDTRGKSDTIYAVLEDNLYGELDRKIGIKMRKIGEPKLIEKYNGTVNHLVEMTPPLATSQIHENDMRRLARIKRGSRLAETVLGQPYAPFFERDKATRGLGRVSLSDLGAPVPAQFERNEGFYSPAEQEKLWRSTVAIAGVGGDGGQLALAMAMSGVRNFRIADPEVFEIQNLNRQTGASLASIGHNKAEVIAKMLRDLGASVEVFPEGINQQNVADFVDGSDLIFDETEFTMPQLGVMIARQARQRQLPVLMAMNVGFGSYTTSFDPKGMTFEDYLGLKIEMSIEDIAKWAENPENVVPIRKWAPHIPSYGNVNILKKIAEGAVPAPTVVQGVMAAAADAGTQAVAHLLRDVNPEWNKWISWAPKGRVFDVKDGMIEVKARRFHFNKSLATAALQTIFGKSHPKHQT